MVCPMTRNYMHTWDVDIMTEPEAADVFHGVTCFVVHCALSA